MADLYSVAWQEWELEKRLQAMKDCGIQFNYYADTQTVDLFNPLSSGMREAFEFLRDPTYAVKFHIFDSTFGKRILKLHTDFWTWRFSK